MCELQQPGGKLCNPYDVVSFAERGQQYLSCSLVKLRDDKQDHRSDSRDSIRTATAHRHMGFSMALQLVAAVGMSSVSLNCLQVLTISSCSKDVLG